jgi:hypothetical protein
MSVERMIRELLAWFRRKREERVAALMFERHVVLRLDESGISASYPDGAVQAISWPEVDCVAIETNDTGPWGADVWWLLEGGNKRCAYPQGARGDPEALAEYQKRFPGFSDATVIEAMGCTSNARFVCWERKRALASDSAHSPR